MDQRLAVEPHVAPLLAFGAQAGLVAEGVVDAVHNDPPLRPRGQQAQPKARLQRQAVRPRPAAQLARQIVGAHHHALQPGMGGNRGRVQHAGGRFHHGPQRKIGHKGGHRTDPGGRGHLRDQQRIDLGPGKGFGIGPAPGRVKAVDADDPNARTILRFRQPTGQKGAGAILFLGKHGIFQIEDDRIGRQAARLLQRAFLGPRDVQHRTKRPRLLIHDSP